MACHSDGSEGMEPKGKHFDREESEVRTWDTGLQVLRIEEQRGRKTAQDLEEREKPKDLQCYKARPSKSGQRREEQKSCPSLLEASGVHRAAHSPPQLKTLCSLPGLAVVFPDRSGFVTGQAPGPGRSCECVDFLVAAFLL